MSIFMRLNPFKRAAAQVVRVEPIVNRHAVGRGARSMGPFDAGHSDNLTAGFLGTNNSVDQDIFPRLRIMRSRSRNLGYNNDYARRFLAMCQRHIVGPHGPTLSFSPKGNDGKVDKADKKTLEAAFWDWAKPENCDVTGQLSFVGHLQQVIRAVARDGECIVREVYGQASGNKYGYALQLLDIDRLDEQKNQQLSGGSIIKMGVELTKFGKPVALWLRTRHPGDTMYWDSGLGYGWERVSLDEIHHLYLFERPEQTRGLPWMISAIIRLNHLGRFDEAAVVASRVGASKMGWWETPDGTGDALADGKDALDNLVTDADPGTFQVAPPGYKLNNWNPDYPHQNYGPFVKSALRGIASGLDVSYNGLSNDLEGVNFSSIRTGVLEEREAWMLLQNWLIERYIDRVTSKWLKMALLNGAIVGPTGQALPLSKLSKFSEFIWRGRRWQWVDPLNDANTAKVQVLELRVKSRRMVADEQGVDFDLVLDELEQEEEEIKARGLETVAEKQVAVQAAQVVNNSHSSAPAA